jgi:hypothetical protein
MGKATWSVAYSEPAHHRRNGGLEGEVARSCRRRRSTRNPRHGATANLGRTATRRRYRSLKYASGSRLSVACELRVCLLKLRVCLLRATSHSLSLSVLGPESACMQGKRWVAPLSVETLSTTKPTDREVPGPPIRSHQTARSTGARPCRGRGRGAHTHPHPHPPDERGPRA